MFSDVGQARTTAAMLLLPIATTSSRTCTKRTVVCRTSFASVFELSTSVIDCQLIEVQNTMVVIRKYPSLQSFQDYVVTIINPIKQSISVDIRRYPYLSILDLLLKIVRQ